MPLPNIKNIVWTAVQSVGVQWPSALTDWLKRASITINGAKKTANTTDDFSSDGWNYTGAGSDFSYDGTNDEQDFTIPNTLSATKSYRDLGASSVSDEKWTLRAKFRFDNFTTNSTGTIKRNFFGIFDSTNDMTTAQDGIFITYGSEDGVRRFSVNGVNGTAPNVSTGTVFYTPSSIDTVYFEIIRISTTEVRATIYSDSDYTNVLASQTITISASIISLRYLHNSNRSGAVNGTISGSLDDVEFWDGETVVENIPSQQTAVLDDDFSGTDDWTDSDSTIIGVNTTTDVLDFKEKDGNFDEVSYYNITALGTDASFVLRLKLNIGTITQTGNADSIRTLIGISSADDIATETARDEVGIIWRVTNTINKFYAFTADGIALPTSGTDFATTPSTTGGDGSGNYYVEIIGNNGTYTFKLYSDSTYSTLIESETITDAGITGLDNIVIRSSTLTTTNNQARGTIDDVQFYNNITEVNPSTLTDYPIPIKITGNTNLQRRTNPSLEDDFDTTSGTFSSGADHIVYDSSQQAIRANTDNTAQGEKWILDLTSVNDTKWTAHGKLTFNTVTQGSVSNQHRLTFGLTDSDETVLNSGNQDFIGVELNLSNSLNNINIMDTDGSAPRTVTEDDTFTRNVTDAGILFWEIRRLSTTKYDVALFADNAHTILIERLSGTCVSTTDTLRYFTVMIDVPNTGDDHVIDISVDEFKFWDNTTNPVNQETATFTEDWTATPSGQNITGTEITESSNRINFAFTLNGAEQTYALDIADASNFGENLSDEKWCGRFKLFLQDVTASNTARFVIGISDTVNAEAGGESQNLLGFYTDGRSANDEFFGAEYTGTTLVIGSEIESINGTGVNITRYVEFIRESVTSFKVNFYSDSNYSILIGTSTVTAKTTHDALRYFVISIRNVSGTCDIEGYIDDLEIWNGISSPNASARKFVFTDNVTDDTATEYSSETISYDPINGDYYGYVRIPSLTTGADTTIQMYYDYQATNPSYVPEITPRGSYTETTVTESGGSTNITSWQADNDKNGVRAVSGSQFENKTVTEISFWLKKTGSPTGTAKLRYHKTQDDDDFVELGDIDLSALTTGYVKTTFNSFTPFVWETDGQIVIDINGNADSSNYLNIQGQSTELYDGVLTYRVRTVNDGAWSNLTTHDLNIEIKNEVEGNREQSTWDSNHKAVYHLQGNSIDSTVYGNDGTETSVDWEEQNNSVGLLADGANTDTDHGADSSLTNIFDSGGNVGFTINPKSDGESNIGVIIYKRESSLGWSISVREETSGFVKIRIYSGFGTTDGHWTTTNAVVPLNETTFGSVIYDFDSVNNNPILILNGIKYTVGNGLTETQTPAGTRDNDVNANLILANNDADTTTFDGLIDNVTLSDKSRPSSHAITTYNAEKSDTDFVTFGTEETQ